MSGTFAICQEVTIYADTDINPPSTLLFRGILEDINYKGDDQLNEELILKGRDYSVRLKDITIQPTFYLNTEIGIIVRNLINFKYLDINLLISLSKFLHQFVALII